MAFTLDDLRQLAHRVRSPRDYPTVRAMLREDNYGTDWCLTDILRLEEEVSATLSDIVCGSVKGHSDPERRVNVAVTLRSVTNEPWSFIKVRPQGEAPLRMTDLNGVAHHLPQQWEPQTFEYPSQFQVPLADDNWKRCAHWLLYNYGWMAAQGGHARRRYSNKQAQQGDRWQLVEQAFELLHPELSPKGRKNVAQSNEKQKEEKEEQRQVTQAEAPAPKKRGRPRKQLEAVTV